MSRSMTRWLEQQASVRERRGLVRRPVARRSGEPGIDLASNDYLGLARDPRLAAAAAEAAREWGTGATASRLVAGTTQLHLALEAELAQFAGMEAGLVFSSGYLANIGVITARTRNAHRRRRTVPRLDRGRLPPEPLPHRDLRPPRSRRRRAPPRRAQRTARDHRRRIRLQRGRGRGAAGATAGAGGGARRRAARRRGPQPRRGRHGTVRGPRGRGRDHAGGKPARRVAATLSKALGSQGGAVLGSAALREHLVNRARGFIFDTALAPTSAAAALAAVGIVRDEPWRAERVRANAAALLAGLGATLPDPSRISHGAGAVQSIAMPSPEAAISAARAAVEAGVRVGCFRPPSVPDGISRLRLTAHAGLFPDDVDHACSVLAGLLKETT